MPKIPKHLSYLYRERRELVRQLHGIGPLIRGSVVELRRSCGKENCKKCRTGEKHPATYLSLSLSGKTQMIYLSKKDKQRAKRWVSNYRKLAEIVEKLSRINTRILSGK